ncbi:MAG: transcriptional repressor LexA [Candidatus Eremiobacteraeota bacterium]|nr:transcriptional repressor LexA [Candidatus Eremiobacteraeota bacterium]
MPGSTQSKSRLSRRQQQILEFIRESVEARGFPPSIREIGEAVGLSSSSTVHSHLRSLETKGYLRRNPSKPRSIELLDGPKGSRARLVDLPVGAPTAGENPSPQKTISLPLELAGSKESFLFPVEETYRQEAIVPGDLVIVNRNLEIAEGDMVLRRDGESVILQRIDSNGNRPPAGERDPRILGRVVGVIRKLPNG